MIVLKKAPKWLIIVAVLLVVAVLFGFENFGNKVVYEDTNGDDVFTLQTITDENIIKRDIGASGLVTEENSLNDTINYLSKSFSGVELIYGENIIGNRFEITVNHAKVTKGNFKMVLLEGDEIVHEFKLNELTQTYVLENPSGYVALVIAGESAEIQFDYSII